MARRLLDTPFFQVENIIDKVYYNDGYRAKHLHRVSQRPEAHCWLN
jgi:hypothetical protein